MGLSHPFWMNLASSAALRLQHTSAPVMGNFALPATLQWEKVYIYMATNIATVIATVFQWIGSVARTVPIPYSWIPSNQFNPVAMAFPPYNFAHVCKVKILQLEVNSLRFVVYSHSHGLRFSIGVSIIILFHFGNVLFLGQCESETSRRSKPTGHILRVSNSRCVFRFCF